MSRARKSLTVGLLCAALLNLGLLGALRAESPQDESASSGYTAYSLSTGGGST